MTDANHGHLAPRGTINLVTMTLACGCIYTDDGKRHWCPSCSDALGGHPDEKWHHQTPLCNAAKDLLAALDRLLEATGGCNFLDNVNADFPTICPGQADPMYGTPCPWCEAHAVIARATKNQAPEQQPVQRGDVTMSIEQANIAAGAVETMSTASPGPFSYEPIMGRILAADGTFVCMVYYKNEKANARLIVQACNAYFKAKDDWQEADIARVRP